MTKLEWEILSELAREIRDINSWLDDSAYPKTSRRNWDSAVMQLTTLLSSPTKKYAAGRLLDGRTWNVMPEVFHE